MNSIICGILTGICNVVPGVSGGSILLITGFYFKLLEAINNPFNYKSISLLGKFIVGMAIGVIVFAKLLNFLFAQIPVATIFAFILMILLSIPSFIKKYISKLNYFYLLSAIILIIGLNFFKVDTLNYNPTLPEITPQHLLFSFGVGIIAGATMIMPGISGSMVLMIIGYYYLFKSYLANLLSLELKIIVPLLVIGIGVLIGVLIVIKLNKFLLDHYPNQFNSFLLGLMIASIIILVPTKGYDGLNIIFAIIFLAISLLIVYIYRKKGVKNAI